jgi:hypothetical protein
VTNFIYEFALCCCVMGNFCCNLYWLTLLFGFQFPDNVESSDAPGTLSNKPTVISSCDRQAIVFTPAPIAQPNEASASEEVSDDFFDVTTGDLRSMQRILAEDAYVIPSDVHGIDESVPEFANQYQY